jgi:hypothetical protein
VRRDLLDPGGVHIFEGGDETYILRRGSASAEVRKGRLILRAPQDAEPISFIQRRGRETMLDVEAREVRVRCFADLDRDRVDVSVEMIDCVIGAAGDRTQRPNFPRDFSVVTPPALVSMKDRTVSDYFASSPEAQQQRLGREVVKLQNSVISELNARVSFGVSCFILVMVGCALGMMFRSGNFLSAFAVSVIPALLSVALIVTGQHTCENVPWNISSGQWTNPLGFGLLIIWSGNAAVAVIAVVLLWRLQRQ